MSFSEKYVITRVDIADPKPGKAVGFGHAMIRYHQLEKRFQGPVRLVIDGAPGVLLPVAEASRRMRRKIRTAKVGTRIIVHPDSGPHVSIRKVRRKDPTVPANIDATRSVQVAAGYIFAKYSWTYNNGVYVDKPGLHGTHPSDAIDFGVTYDTSDQAHERVMVVFGDLRRQGILYAETNGKQGLALNGVIGMSSICGPDVSDGFNQSVRAYSGEQHVTHCHMSGPEKPYELRDWV